MSKKNGKGLRLADVTAKAKPRTVRVSICLDGEARDAILQAEEELAEAKNADKGTLAGNPEVKALLERIDALEARAQDAMVEFVFRGLSDKTWSDLVTAHPPTSEQRKQGAQFNPDKFPAAAIAKCLESPTVDTPEDVEALREVLNVGEWTRLWVACQNANMGAEQSVPTSAAASAIRRGWRQNSTTVST